jgi:hypothetical protein
MLVLRLGVLLCAQNDTRYPGTQLRAAIFLQGPGAFTGRFQNHFKLVSSLLQARLCTHYVVASIYLPEAVLFAGLLSSKGLVFVSPCTLVVEPSVMTRRWMGARKDKGFPSVINKERVDFGLYF